MSTISFKNNFFSLVSDLGEEDSKIIMKLLIPVVNTRYIPRTYALLQKELPSVLESECFNDEGNPFSEEVKRTEIGHLFEHILLEYLCKEQYLNTGISAVYNGLTSWNWEKDEEGIFHITIDISDSDREVFIKAIDKTILLTSLILQHASIKKSRQFLTLPAQTHS